MPRLQHGVRNTYNYHKCRCPRCRKANTLHQQQLRKNRKANSEKTTENIQAKDETTEQVPAEG